MFNNVKNLFQKLFSDSTGSSKTTSTKSLHSTDESSRLGVDKKIVDRTIYNEHIVSRVKKQQPSSPKPKPKQELTPEMEGYLIKHQAKQKKWEEKQARKQQRNQPIKPLTTKYKADLSRLEDKKGIEEDILRWKQEMEVADAKFQKEKQKEQRAIEWAEQQHRFVAYAKNHPLYEETLRSIHHHSDIVQAVMDVRTVKGKLNESVELEYNYAFDTNYLMHEKELFQALLHETNLPIYISSIVQEELDRLKDSEIREVNQKARAAFHLLEDLQRQGRLIRILKYPTSTFMEQHRLNKKSPDDRIIASYILANEEDKMNLLFFSNDVGARILARDAGLPVYEK